MSDNGHTNNGVYAGVVTDASAATDTLPISPLQYITDLLPCPTPEIRTKLENCRAFARVPDLKGQPLDGFQLRTMRYVECAMLLLGRKMLYSLIVDGLMFRFEQEGITLQQCHEAIEAAQVTLRTRAVQYNKKDFRAESIAFYESIAGDPSIDMKHRLNAQKALDKLLGLQRPVIVLQAEQGEMDSLDRLIEDRKVNMFK